MPFNQLILPLLGGYIFVNHTYLLCYWASRHSKEHLVFLSAVAGAFLLVTARSLSWLFAGTTFGHTFWIGLHHVAPFPGIGTAVMAFFLGFFFRWWFNRAWTKTRAPLWLYAAGQFNKIEELLFTSAYPIKPDAKEWKHPNRKLFLGLIWWQSIQAFLARHFSFMPAPSDYTVGLGGEPLPVMFCLKNRKVYVGFIEYVLPMRAESKSYITVLPAWSGYRDKDTMNVVPTTDYMATYFRLSEGAEGKGANADADADVSKKNVALDIGMFVKTICMEDIESASLYDEESFNAFSDPAAEVSEEAAGTSSDPDVAG